MTRKRAFKIFISSTFQDMVRERNYIIERVIAPFKEKAREHNVDVSVVDLRWGITPEEAKDGRVLEICLRQIDNCRPLFIGIVGNRYGWCPPYEDFLKNDFLRTKYPEIEEYFKQGLSITEMEMQYGAINSKRETDAIFFLQVSDSSNQCNITEKEDELRLRNLREKISAECKIKSFTYSVNDLESFYYNSHYGSFGERLNDWLEKELMKYFPEKEEDVPEVPVHFESIEQRRKYLLDILEKNGKSISAQQANIILLSAYTQTKDGLDAFIEDMLTFGVFEELDTFIHWRASVSVHDYLEYVLKRRFRMYSVFMIHTIQALVLSQRGAKLHWLQNVFYQNFVQEDYKNSYWNIFWNDLRHYVSIEEVEFDDEVLYRIDDVCREIIQKELLPDEETIERSRIRLVEAILNFETYDLFLKTTNQNEYSYSELMYQMAHCPSLERYEYSWEEVCHSLLRNFSGFEYSSVEEFKGKNLLTIDDYRLISAEIRLYMEFYCTRNEWALYQLLEFVYHHVLFSHRTQDIMPPEEYQEMRFLCRMAIEELRQSENEYIWESVGDWMVEVGDDSYGEKSDDILWYEGELNEDLLPHGRGKAYFRNCDSYEGDWMYGEMHGDGIFEKDGEYVYEGNFSHGVKEGYGAIYYLSDEDGYEVGDHIEGEFQDNAPNGYGTLYYANGSKYEGDFLDGLFNGKGVYTSPWFCYEGEFEDGLFDGHGKIDFYDGRIFEGAFSNNCMNGEGILHLPDGATITGHWMNDRRVGLFTLTLPDGRQYQRKYTN